jgi:very-short-patch-repair endonuclease
MTLLTLQSAEARRLLVKQHWVISHAQLTRLGLTREGIKHAARRGQLRRLWRGVYAVGPQEPTQYGRWMGAVLACGDGAMLSHRSAAELYDVRPWLPERPIHLSIPLAARRTLRNVTVHRRAPLRAGMWRGIPVTTIADTLVDIAPDLTTDEVEATIGAADVKGLTDPDKLRRALDETAPRRGVGILKRVLDRRTYVMTHTHLERLFMPIARRVGLPKPQAQRYLGTDRVDFLFETIGLVVEVDGLTYHRTPAQQAEDHLRDQRRIAQGLIPLRFSHWQVRYEPASAERALRDFLRRPLGRAPR